jgi:hemerythrin-like domain-containing protein
MASNDQTRRGFIGAMSAGTALWLSGADSARPEESGAVKKEPEKEAEKEAEEVSASEDLMREHGVLDRVLLVYDEALRRLAGRLDLPPDAVSGGARIVRRFIEDYHEKLEEEHLFPRFEKARKLTDLVSILRAQHRAGRRVTDEIQSLATAASLKDDAGRRRLAAALTSFVRMYRPHSAREDTVPPAFRRLVTPNEYGALGEQFEEKEHQLFGEDGFGKVLDQVAALEKRLGIDDLARFTPA